MDFNLLTLAELRNLAKEKNIKGVTGLKKDALAALLSEKLGNTGEGKAPAKDASKEAEAEPKKRGRKPAAKKVEANEGGVKAEEQQTTPEPKKRGRKPKTEAPAEPLTKEEKAPVAVNKTQTVAKEIVTPSQPVRVESAGPVKRPVAPMQGQRPAGVPYRTPGMRPAGDQRPAMGARPAGEYRPAQGAMNNQRPMMQNRPVGEQRPVMQNRPAGERPAQGPADRNQPAVPEGASRAETLEAMIAQNYALAGTPQDSGETKEGILEVMPEGFAFVRCDNFLPGNEDVYVSPAQVKRFGLKTGDYIVGNTKVRMPNEKFSALLYINTVNKLHLSEVVKRKKFEDLTPVFPNSRFHLETPGCGPAMRMVDLLSPIGKGQRGMIVSQPKAGKTTLLKQIAKALIRNHPSIHLIILLIDERPEEVTDMKESISGENVEVIYSTFDEQPENHKRVSEMVIERARRLVEQKQDVVILLDSITRLARAYNLTITASGRTLSGGLDPAALYMPKRFFGAARCMREGGSLTVLATALVETGSRMDDVVFEEFKGTGNMELVLDRNLSERRVFPAIDLPKSGTRREDLLLTPAELEASNIIRRAFNSSKTDEVVERIINLFTHTRNNAEFVEVIKKTRIVP